VRARAGELHAGDVAPEFNLQTARQDFARSAFFVNAKGPVVLVSGAIPDPPSGGGFRLNNSTSRCEPGEFSGGVHLEAHPSDVWQMKSNLGRQGCVRFAENEKRRAFVAGACVRKWELNSRGARRLDNTVEKATQGWPDRLYLIDRDGRVAYKSRQDRRSSRMS